MAAIHSSMSISPSLDVSSMSGALLNLAGWVATRFGSPPLRKSTTSLSLLTHHHNSSLVSVPESSLSINSKQLRGLHEWAVNSAISRCRRGRRLARLLLGLELVPEGALDGGLPA